MVGFGAHQRHPRGVLELGMLTTQTVEQVEMQKVVVRLCYASTLREIWHEVILG